MKTKKYYNSESSDYELLKFDNRIIVKDKKATKYYETDNTELFSMYSWEEYKSKLNLKLYIIYLIILVVLLFINLFVFFFVKFDITNKNALVIVLPIVYTLFNALLHELGHIKALHMFGKKHDSVGIKFNYIFPSIFVRMNESYMLTKNEKIIVHSAGIFVNVIINSIVILIGILTNNNFIIYICNVFTMGIIMNSTPILNSDGYKILLAITSYNKKKDKIHNSIYIKLLGYCNIIISIYYLINMILNSF